MSELLKGVRVLDMGRVAAGPHCALLLASLGADVIKIERPGTGDDTRGNGFLYPNGESAYFLQQNWGKRSIVLDLKSAAAMEVMHRLVRSADVLVENFRPGTLEKLGLGWEALQQINPRLILCSISAYGQTGPEAQRPGYGAMIEARAGIPEMTGDPDGPPMPTPLPIADFLSASHGFGMVAAALYERERTGRGRHIDVALLDCAVEVHDWAIELHSASQGAITPRRRGLRDDSIIPWGYFQAADGWICIIASNDSFWRKLATLIGRPELGTDAAFATNAARVNRASEVYSMIEAWVGEQSASEACALLAAADIPVEKLQTIPELLHDPQIAHRGMIVDIDHPRLGAVKVVNTGVRTAEGPNRITRVAPLLGEHTAEVLSEIGYDAAQIAALHNRAAVFDGSQAN